MLLTFAALSHACASRAAAQDAATPSAGGFGPHEAAWARYTYPGDEFSAELPGMPFVMHSYRSVDNRPANEEKVRVFGRYSGGVVFFLVAYDRPRPSETFDQLTSFLRGAWALAPQGGATLGGFEGRAYKVVSAGGQGASGSHGLHGEGRVFV
ncbi:MAG TPA: hypothetical protein VF611_04740, partial [Pyrinomonadaceae bacterium]